MEQTVFFFGKTAYVTYKFLTDRGVPHSTVYNNTSSKVSSEKRWYTSSLPFNRNRKIIDYDSIPHSLVSKHGLPNYIELREIADLQVKETRDELKVNVSKHVKIILDLEYNSWKDLKCIYENQFLTDEKLEMYCKTHAVLSKIVELNELGYKLNGLFSAFYQYDNLIFETDNYHSFCNKIRQIKKGKPIEKVLIHGLMNKPSNNLKKEEDVIIEIERAFGEGKALNGEQILEKVNDYLIRTNRKTITLPSIYNVISQPYIKNKLAVTRYGKKYLKNNILPYSHFMEPSHEGILWVMDGSRFQFAYKVINGKRKYDFLTFFIVMEARNRKIISYTYDESENSAMVKKALEKCCESLSYLPREIISDNSPAFKSNDLIKFQALYKIWGGFWHKTVDNPRDNAYAERFFGVFQESFCKKYDGYIGDGIKSKNLNGKPSPEEIKQYLSSKKLMTKDELILLLSRIVKDYNSSTKREALVKKYDIDRENSLSKIIEPVRIETIRHSQLFWPIRLEKVFHGEISFDINRQKYIYQFTDDHYELLLKIHGTKVNISFNPNDLSKILLFDVKDNSYLTTLNRYKRIPKAIIERTEDNQSEFYKNLSKSKNLEKKFIEGAKEIFRLSDQNRAKLPPKFMDFGIGTKSECEESEKDYMSEELEKISVNELSNENIDFETMFKQMYLKKGNLKVVTYGKN